MKVLSLTQPHLLIMVGIPGSGKTFFAERFAATFKAPLVNYSEIMEISSHHNHVSDVFAGYMLKELFKTTQTIVFDGPSATKAERTALKDLAATYGYTCLFIWVQTDPATAQSRFLKDSRRNGRHTSASQYNAIIREFTAPVPKEHQFVVISGKHTYATQVKAVLKNLTLTKQVVRADAIREQKPLNVGKRNITIQ